MTRPADEAQRRALLDPKAVTALRRSLMTWYRHHARDLPWRVPPPAPGCRASRPDPYAVMVSEAMLQQTQVATVIAYYRRFMARFPTPAALAAASEQQVLKLWEGLGYYRRARLLHAAARAVLEQHGGRFPDRFDEILALPGVGQYTAGAIASIAFGLAVPAVDGNVIRVVSRLLALEEPPDRAAVIATCRQTAGRWVSPKHPGDFNQAMMELGAMVCRPRQPDCPRCPLRRLCLGRAAGRAEQLGVGAGPATVKVVVHRVYVVERHQAGGGVAWLMRQRAGMWEFVTVESEAHDDIEQSTDSGAIGRPRPTKGRPVKADPTARTSAEQEGQGRGCVELCDLLVRLGVLPATACKLRPQLLTTFEHRTTHRRICFEAYRVRLTGRGGNRAERAVRRGAVSGSIGGPAGGISGLCWATASEIAQLPLSNPQRRILALLEGDEVS